MPKQQRANRAARSMRALVPERATRGAGAEEFLGLPQRLDKGVHFVARVVEVEAGARGGGDAEFLVERHRAMMTGPDGDAFLIEEGRQIVRMNVAERERDETTTFFHVERTVDDDFDELFQPIDGVLRDFF